MTQVLNRTALVLLAGSLLAACATTPDGGRQAPQPNYPIIAPEPPAAAEPPPPQARPSGSVESRALAPPPGAEVAPARPTPAQPAYLPPPPVRPSAPSAPSVQTVTRTAVTGKVVDAAGPPKTHKVEKGDTVYSIARKFDVAPDQLAKDNGLKKPYVIHPGQTLKGPSSKAKAYQVVSGDTLFAVGRRFSVSPQALAEANDISVDRGLRVGQKIVLPAGYKDKGPTTTTVRVPVAAPAPEPAYVPPAPAYVPPTPTRAPPAPRPAAPTPAPATPIYAPAPPVQPRPAPVTPPPAPAPVAAPPPAPVRTPEAPPISAVRPTAPPIGQPAPPAPMATAPPKPPSSAPVIIPTTPTASDAQISQLGKGRFLWPIRGALISDFGPKGTGQRNDGVNIRAVPGEPVRAAAAGDVVYAGDQVPGFGNLVLVKHADGWVTAYGHLSRVDVKMQDKVTQGQQIGQAGSTGGVAEPQLHFEVRYAPTPADRARPINPQLVLPK